jgi:uncharacterized damage-inducible protein DinB
MNLAQTVTDLYRHQAWADAAIWSAVIAHAPAAGDAIIQERLGHIHLVQWLFLQAWQGSELDAPTRTFTNAAARLAWGRSYHEAVTGFVTAVNTDRLEQRFALPWAGMVEESLGFPPGPVTLRETLLQVPLHSTYHRGQVATRLRDVGATPPMTDFIVWLFLGKPLAGWPSPVAGS